MAYTIIPLGTSEPYDFQLSNDGAPLDGSNLTVTLHIYRSGVLQSTAPLPAVAWLSQAGGTVRVTGMQHLALGTYRVRYRLQDAGTTIGYAPNQTNADTWNVVKLAG
jgi:hypothetical protein